MKSSLFRLSIWCVAMLTLAGCAVGPNYKRPVVNTPTGGKTMNSYLGGFEAVWEIDLWGRVRRMNEATRANFMASQEGRRAVMISVVSGVAQAYFELLELDEQLVIAQRTGDSYQRT